MPPLSPPHLYMSNYLMATSSVPLAQLPPIGQAYHGVPHRLTSFPNSTHTPSFPSASSVTMIALLFLTNTMSLSNATTTTSFTAPAYPMDFGAHSPQPQANALIPADTQKDLVQWLHAAAFSPRISTFLDAVECNFFTTWLNLTPQVIHHHLCTSIATVKGHLDQQCQQQRKPTVNEPPPSPLPTKSHSIYAAIIDPHQSTGSSYSDLTGHFPIQSNHGANYIIVLCEYTVTPFSYAHSATTVPMKSNTSSPASTII